MTHIHIHITRDSAEPGLSDIQAAQRGNRMNSLSLAELEDLVKDFRGKETFAAKAIVIGAKQMIAAKKRAGAQDSTKDAAPVEYKGYSITQNPASLAYFVKTKKYGSGPGVPSSLVTGFKSIEAALAAIDAIED